MNLHAIPTDRKLFLLSAVDSDGEARFWWIRAQDYQDARRAEEILDRIAEGTDYEVHDVSLMTLDDSYFSSPDQIIQELKANWDWVFEDDEDEDEDEDEG